MSKQVTGKSSTRQKSLKGDKHYVECKVTANLSRVFNRAILVSSNGFVSVEIDELKYICFNLCSMMKKIEPSEIGKNPDLIASEFHCLQFLLF